MKRSELILRIFQEKSIDPKVIIDTLCDYFDITVYELRSHDKSRPLTLYRQIAMKLLKRLTKLTLKQIAIKVGLTNHTSVIHALTTRKINPFQNEYYELLHILSQETYTRSRFKKDVLADFFVMTSL